MKHEAVPGGSQERSVRRLRWFGLGQVAVFLYAVLIYVAIFSLAMADRWEFWVLLPMPSVAIIALYNWGRWFLAESPNEKIRHDAESAVPKTQKGNK